MNKIQLYTCAAAIAIISSACGNDDDRFYPQGEGRLEISPEIKSDLKVVSRAVADDDELYNSLILWISNSKGLVRQYNGRDEIPQNDWLVAGDYVAEAWAGDSVSASFDKRWFKGREPFSIRVGQSTQLTIPCRIANVLVDVVYEGDVFSSLSNARFTVGHSRGELVYEGEYPGVGYFMMPSTDTDLVWTFEAEGPNGPVSQEGVIENAQSATKYILTVRAGKGDKPVGGTFFNIKIDTTRERVYQDFVIELPPIIDGYDFSATSNDVFMQGEVGRRSIFITGSSTLIKAQLELKGLSTYLGMTDGKPFDDVNFISTSDQQTAFLEEVASHGINAIFDPIPGSTETSVKINFEEEFTNSLPAGEYVFIYSAKDDNGRESSLTRTLRITNASIALNDANDYDVWSHKATISADVLQADFGNATFQYRPSGSASWSDASPRLDTAQRLLVADITGLQPGTVYEFRIISDKDSFESEVKTFTTEAELQLPNAGFEQWNTDSKAWLLCSDASSMFWDSGNHGSASMNKNITQPDETISHSGKAIKMESQFVGIGIAGKFAAGNAFIGQYLATEGTDGQLGWGRPFASRPKALKGYVKYNPAVVDKRTCDYIKKGDLDQGIIYIAILDNTMQNADADNYVSGVTQKSWPVIIKTKESKRQLFEKTAPNVIAYGEKVFDAATPGDNLIEFEIPLEYFKNDIKAANIIVTMSASRYGDYFAGGENSIMWVDDLELVY